MRVRHRFGSGSLLGIGCILAFAMPMLAQAPPTASPVSELPADVVARADRCTLFIRWPGKEQSEGTAYLVNRTKNPVQLQTLYGGCYLYLEAQTSPGTWERAQPHVDELCGVGMGQFELPPGHWIAQPQSIPARTDGGEVLPIRYRCYDRGFDASSNASQGVLVDGWLNAARNDSMAIRQATPERLQKILLGQDSINDRPPMGPWNPQHTAIYALTASGHDRAEVIAVLKAVIEKGNEFVAGEAKAALEKLQSCPPPVEKESPSDPVSGGK